MQLEGQPTEFTRRVITESVELVAAAAQAAEQRKTGLLLEYNRLDVDAAAELTAPHALSREEAEQLLETFEQR